MLKYLIKIIKLLNSNSKASQVANSFCVGLVLGLMPKGNLLWFILFVFFLFVRFQKSCYGLMILVGSLVSPLIDPYFDQLGYLILTYEPMEPYFSALLDVPFVGFTRFNNTVVCGSLAGSLICYIPVFLIAYGIIRLWRRFVAPKLNQLKIVKALYNIPLISKIAKMLTEED
ncbi:MAG: TIGR03546 family protein [Treponema sp.]|nr:TIGR03546 family protein [Treponema sp.]